MAYYAIRVNLSSAMFPFLTELWGQSVIVPQYDQNYDRQIVSGADGDKDKGVAQAFFMENVTPTLQGYQAVGYTTVASAYEDGTASDFDRAFTIRNVSLASVVFCPAGGKNYILTGNTASWVSVSPITPGTLREDVQVTTAYIHAETYIYYANYGCFKYNSVTKTLTPVVLAGLVAANVRGITASNGYMIAWTATELAWSNLITETDFVPSLDTGAGGGQLNEADGKIKFCLPISGGFMVYCDSNVVTARYSGNTTFPFITAEIPGSTGVESPEQVSWQANLDSHYVWSSAGLQEISKNSVRQTFIDATDFLAALQFEDFDSVTNTFTQIDLAQPLYNKLAIIGSRFLVISYGVTRGVFTHALFYDISMKRWGKLKITHTDCFEWLPPSVVGPLTYGDLSRFTYGGLSNFTYGDLAGTISPDQVIKKTISFLQQDGTVKNLNFDLSESEANGVLITGKYQFMRNKTMVHILTSVETVRTSAAFTVHLLGTFDGKTLQPAVKLVETTKGNKVREFERRTTFTNYSLLLKGQFHVNTIVLQFTPGGSR